MGLEGFNLSVYHIMMLVGTVIVSFFGGPTNDQPIAQPGEVISYTIEQTTPDTPEVLGSEAIYEPTINLIDVPPSLAKEAAQVIVTPSPTPSPTPVPFSLYIVAPTASPSPTPKPTPTPSPTPKPQPVVIIPPPLPDVSTNSLDADLILEMINQKRATLNLPAFQKDDELCQLAQYRAPQLNNEIFNTGALHLGLYDLNLPYWFTENMAHYDSESQILSWWMNSKIHRAAILSSAKYSCGACSGNSCAQLFTSYVPK